MRKKLSKASRVLIAIASFALIAVFVLPVWRIDLFAPQYPEGLTMNIWITKLTGDVEIINGLNHYIGMKLINESMFPEFKILPYVVGFYLIFGLIVAITGNRRLLLAYLILTVIGGVLAMYDFYQWGYDYGHHLDPNAPIQVAGLSYQPPLFGHKRLLNFDAYSFPHSGGWVVISAAVLAFIVWLMEEVKSRKKTAIVLQAKAASILLAISFTLSSCSSKPSPIVIGKDNCTFCKMVIMDLKYAGEIVTKKGKVYKFDDLHCLISFTKNHTGGTADFAHMLGSDYYQPANLIPVETSWFVRSGSISSPMGGQKVGFSDKAAAEKFSVSLDSAELLSWADIIEAK